MPILPILGLKPIHFVQTHEKAAAFGTGGFAFAPFNTYSPKNRTTATYEVTANLRNRIKELNTADLELYNRAKNLKKGGYWE